MELSYKNLERLSAKIENGGDNIYDCWLWTACLDANGYAKATVNKKLWSVHRLFYIYIRGVIPPGLVLDHLCETPNCVNPWHLEAVTQFINVHRYYDKITHCKWGHPFSPENTYVEKRKGRGKLKRHCKTCSNARSRARRARLKRQI